MLHSPLPSSASLIGHGSLAFASQSMSGLSLAATPRASFQVHSAFHSPILLAQPQQALAIQCLPLGPPALSHHHHHHLSEFSSPIHGSLGYPATSRRFSEADECEFDAELFNDSPYADLMIGVDAWHTVGGRSAGGFRNHQDEARDGSLQESCLLKVISRASSVSPHSPYLEPEIQNQALPPPPPQITPQVFQAGMIERTAMPPLLRSQSENTYHQASVIPVSSRPSGSLSKYRVHVPPALNTELPVELPVIDLPLGKFAYNPFVKIEQVVPSTPVPVGAQWVHLSRRPKLHAHCMRHLENIDDTKEAIMQRIAHLAQHTSIHPQHANLLLERVQAKFASARVEATQLYLQRAKIQSTLEKEAAARGIILKSEEDDDEVTMSTRPIQSEIPPPVGLDELADAEVASVGARAHAVASPAMPMLERSASMLEHEMRSDSSDAGSTASTASVHMASPPPLGVTTQAHGREDEDEDEDEEDDEAAQLATSKRHPPPMRRRAQSVQFRKPSASACRRLNFEPRSTSAVPSWAELLRQSPSMNALMRSSCNVNTSRQSPANLPLQEWLMENLTDPYPSPDVKAVLSEKSGLNFNQVSHWFINARMRTWKPLIQQVKIEQQKLVAREVAATTPHAAIEQQSAKRQKVCHAAEPEQQQVDEAEEYRLATTTNASWSLPVPATDTATLVIASIVASKSKSKTKKKSSKRRHY